MIKEITIRPALNGFVCSVGCQTVVASSISDLVVGISDYYRNPAETEKKWLSCALNKTMNNVAEVPCPPPTTQYPDDNAGKGLRANICEGIGSRQ
jgi:hypothetical protein